MKKTAPCTILLAFALAFVGCNLQDEPEKSDTLQDALNAGGEVNLADYDIPRSRLYTISKDTIITGDAKGAHFAIADGTDVTFNGTKDIGTVTAGSTASRNAAVRAASRGGIKISLKGSGVTIGKVFIKVDCTFTSDSDSNSFGSVVVAETVTSLTLAGNTKVSALVATGEASVKITISAEVTIEKADTTVIDSVKENNPNITIDIPKISDDELKALQDAFEEESKKDPADGNTSGTNPGNSGTTNPDDGDDDGKTNPGKNDDDDKNNVDIIPRGSRIAAKYVQKAEIALYADGIAVFTMGLPISGTYTKEANGDLTVDIPFDSDSSDEMVELAKINGNTLSLYYYNKDGSLNEENAITFTKKATNLDPSAMTEWECNGPLSLTFDLDGTVQFFEDAALCWTGTYTVTEDNFAVTENVRQVGNPWHNLASPVKVEFTFEGNALMWDVLYGNGGASNFLTRVGDLTVKTPTSDGNTETTSGGNTSETNPGENTGTTNPDDGDDDGKTNPGKNDDDDKNNVDIIPRGSRIAATYEQKVEIALYADGTAVFTVGLPVSGTYTKGANGEFTMHMPFKSDYSDEDVYLAKINGDTMTLYYYNEDGSLDEDAMIMTKKATYNDPSALTEWEYDGSLSLTFALDGTVQFFEDAALCWTGTYTVTEDNFAVTEDVRQIGSPWGEDDMTSPPLKVEFDLSYYKDALFPDVFTDKGGCWTPFLTRVGNLTVKAPTSGTKS